MMGKILCFQLFALFIVQLGHFTDGKVLPLEARDGDLAVETFLDEREDQQNEVDIEEKREDPEESGASEDSEVEYLDARDVPFKLVDRNGGEIRRNEREGLLLFKGGTVCSDHFDYRSAHAICRNMGYRRAANFREASRLEYGEQQSNRRINLDDVRCGSRRWRNCRYTTYVSRNCNHRDDVLLTCVRRSGL